MIRRHPLRGLLAGLLIGLGVAILLVIYGAAPLGPATVVIVLVVFMLLGVASAWVLPARRVAVPAEPVVAEPVAATTTVDRTAPPDGPAAAPTGWGTPTEHRADQPPVADEHDPGATPVSRDDPTQEHRRDVS